MHELSVERTYPQPREVVFARFVDNEGWTEWAGVGRVRLVSIGAPDRNGVGAVRAFAAPPGLREEVVLFEPPSRMEYRVIAGGGPLYDHHGVVEAFDVAGGTRLVWSVRFRWRIPGTGWLAARGIKLFFSRTLAALARDLDARKG